VTPSVSSKGLPAASEITAGLAQRQSNACTTACTSEPKTVHADAVADLAAALQGLSPDDKARLASLLLQQSQAR